MLRRVVQGSKGNQVRLLDSTRCCNSLDKTSLGMHATGCNIVLHHHREGAESDGGEVRRPAYTRPVLWFTWHLNLGEADDADHSLSVFLTSHWPSVASHVA